MGRYETIIIKPEIVHTEDVVDDLKNVWRIQQIHDQLLNEFPGTIRWEQCNVANHFEACEPACIR